jgi:hypothetical protein
VFRTLLHDRLCGKQRRVDVWLLGRAPRVGDCNNVTNATPLFWLYYLNLSFVSWNSRFVNLCYVRLLLLYSDVIYYIKCCNTVMPLKCDPAQKIMDDSGFPRTPDRLLKFCGTHVWWLEVFKMITSTCGLYYLGGSAIINYLYPAMGDN